MAHLWMRNSVQYEDITEINQQTNLEVRGLFDSFLANKKIPAFMEPEVLQQCSRNTSSGSHFGSMELSPIFSVQLPNV
jgi:hypothetical protein